MLGAVTPRALPRVAEAGGWRLQGFSSKPTPMLDRAGGHLGVQRPDLRPNGYLGLLFSADRSVPPCSEVIV